MPTWLNVVLILTSLCALGLALYCRIFMAPLDHFRKRVSALGGGLKGIESHFTGMAGELQQRLEELEEKSNAQIAEAREGLRGSVDELGGSLRELGREVEKLRREVQSLQAGIRTASSDGTKVARSVESLAKRLQRLRGDFDALDVELRESVRQLVMESFGAVESTVLSALEAMQEEILHDVREPSAPQKPFGRPQPSKPFRSARRPRENIITVEPLFAEPRRKGDDEDAADPAADGQEADEGDGDDSEQDS